MAEEITEGKQADLGLDVEQIDVIPIHASTRKKKAQAPTVTLPGFREIDNTLDIDIGSNQKKIIEVGKGIVRIQQQNPDVSPRELNTMMTAYVNEKLPMWQGLTIPKRIDTLYDAEAATLEDFQIDVNDFLHSADDVVVRTAKLTGSHIGTSAHNLTLDRVLLVSNEGLAGSTQQEYTHDARGVNDRRSLDCENVNIAGSVLIGKSIGRNIRGGIIRNSVIIGTDALKDAWGGLKLENVIIIDQNGVREIKSKTFPPGRPIYKPEKPRENTFDRVSGRFIGKRYK